MMIPNASEITRRRLTASMILRLLAVFVLVLAMNPLIAVATQLVTSNRWINTWKDAFPYLLSAAISSGISVTLWLIAPWAARLMIRVPRVAVCPNCKYKLEGLMSPQCTECGYTLTPEFMTTPDEREVGIREPDTALLRQISTLVIRLVSGIFLPISVIVSFTSAITIIRNPQWNDWQAVNIWAWVAIVSATILIFARRLSIMFVPGRSRFERKTEKTNT